MKLVIVESPGKIKKIQAALGPDYKLASSVGHIIDLPAKTLSVDVDNNFEPTYKPIQGKATVIKDLQALAKKCSEVIIASDKDREGEMIGWSLAKVLNLKDPKRIEFTNLSKEALLNAIKHPGKIDMKMVDSQKARRVLDRIVGYYLSPLLWQNVQPKLSAGRVQSVSVRVIVDREIEIRKFLEDDVKSYYKIKGDFVDSQKSVYNASLYKKNDKAIAKIEDSKDAKKLMKDISGSKFIVTDIEKTKSTKNPGKPFTTSTLTQEAGRKLGFTVKRTMTAAQHLYEESLITYMRTDETVLSNEIIKASENYIVKKFGKNYHKKRQYAKGKNTQGAHEAVRPTDINKETAKIGGKINSDEQKLYSLIWKRTAASQMAPAIYDVATMVVSASNVSKYDFKTTFNSLFFPGFMKVYNLNNIEDENTEDIKTGKLPDKNTKLKAKEVIANTEYTTPPPRFDEPSFVAKLDPEKGLNIGRPATYVQLVSKIQEKNYVEKKDNEGKIFKGCRYVWKGNNTIEKEETETVIGGDKNRLTPTPLGELVTDYLVTRFPTIMDYKFTSSMETLLDKIAEGKEVWYNVIKVFYDKFVPIVNKVKNEKSLKETKIRILGKIDDEEVYVKFGKYGAYIQQGESKIKKAPVKPPLNFDSVKLSDAKKLLEYPKLIGQLNKKQILLKKGKFGLYISMGKQSVNIEEDKKNITLEEAKELLKNAKDKKGNSLNEFKEGTKVYKVLKGPYGLFVNVTDTKDKKVKYNASIPDKTDVSKLTLDDIKKFIEEHFEKKRKRFNRTKK